RGTRARAHRLRPLRRGLLRCGEHRVPADGDHLRHVLLAAALPHVPEGDRLRAAAHLLHQADTRRDGLARAHLDGDRRPCGSRRLGGRGARRRAQALPLGAARNLNRASNVVLTMEPTMAFAAERDDPPAIEVRVNFGVYAGRKATNAEIDRLAEW